MPNFLEGQTYISLSNVLAAARIRKLVGASFNRVHKLGSEGATKKKFFKPTFEKWIALKKANYISPPFKFDYIEMPCSLRIKATPEITIMKAKICVLDQTGRTGKIQVLISRSVASTNL